MTSQVFYFLGLAYKDLYKFHENTFVTRGLGLGFRLVGLDYLVTRMIIWGPGCRCHSFVSVVLDLNLERVVNWSERLSSGAD